MGTKRTEQINYENFAAVRNIPKIFHSSDLRNYFSQIIEEKAFSCFHFRHRPEVIKQNLPTVSDTPISSNEQTFVCVVSLTSSEVLDKFVRIYNGKNWVHGNGDYLKQKCIIVKLNVQDKDKKSPSYLTREEKGYRKRHAAVEDFSPEDLLNMSELKPPRNVMPNGNVGTPISVFLELIKNCTLPASIIKKLGLVFPKTGSHRRYGNVPYNYGDSIEGLSQVTCETVITANGQEILTADEEKLPKSLRRPNEKEEKGLDTNELEESSESDADDCEEWERHEAFTSDPTNQGREKERLFEERIELKWEKGGSGLVFYTDAQYWNEEDGDFDEQNTDQWDVDVNEFYGEDGDRDAKDFVTICREKRQRDGEQVLYTGKKKSAGKKSRDSPASSNHDPRLGSFEKHTRGIGRRLMEKQGWSDNQPLGVARQAGIVQPVEAEGQGSRVKRGLGYHGEKRTAFSVGQEYVTKPLALTASEGSCSSTDRHKITDPLASHSWLFPQFRSNLVSLCSEHSARSREERRRATPGDDGIVITTVYDEPLDIDQDSGILRSSHPYSLKHRRKEDSVTRAGTKLVSPAASLSATATRDATAREVSFSPTMKFVRPVDKSEWTNS